MYNYHKAYTINLRVKISATDYLAVKCKDRTNFNAAVTIMRTSNLLYIIPLVKMSVCIWREVES